jgi:AraC-like DNA-binding protein
MPPAMLEKFTLPPGAHGAVWFYQAHESPVRPMHRHRELELNLVISGRASYVLGDRRYELLAHDLIWLFPAQQHQLIDRSPDYRMWVVLFTPRALKLIARSRAAALLTQQDPPGRFCRSLAENDATALDRLCRELHGCDAGHRDLFNAGLHYLALRSWERFSAREDSPSYHTLHPAVENALLLLRRGEADDSLNRLARQAGLSPARLSRRFKAEVGIGISEYRNRIRLERFVALYGAGTRLTALAAALEAGFRSYAQFHRVFTRLMSYSPAEHRRRVQHRTSPPTEA